MSEYGFHVIKVPSLVIICLDLADPASLCLVPTLFLFYFLFCTRSYFIYRKICTFNYHSW